MPSLAETGINRRTLARAMLGTVAAALPGCGGTSKEAIPPPIATAKTVKKDAAPTVVSTKETPAQRILWTEGMVIPIHPTDLRLTREAFFVSNDLVSFTGPQGYPTAFNIERGKTWRWEEDQALVYGAESDAVYVFRQDKRLLALDAKTGQRRWSRVFPTLDRASLSWPFLICKDTVHPTFHSPQVGSPNPIAGLDKATGEIMWITSGEQKAIGSTQQSIVAQAWAGWGQIFKVDARTGREQELVTIGIYFGDHNRRIVDGQFIFIRYRPTTGRPPIGSIGLADINSGRVIWQNADRDEPAIMLVTPTRIYARWSATFTQQGLLAIDRQTGSTIMQEKEFPKEDFVGEKDDWFVWTQSKLGQTTFTNVVNGATSTNDDLRLTGVAGTVKNILVGFYADPSRRQSLLYGIDITSKNADRKWRVPIEQTTPLPVIVENKVVYSNGQVLQVLDAETGNKLTNIALPGATHFTKHKNTLLVQTGNPGQVGSLSAVRI